MAHDSDRLVLWPGYFDFKATRSSGRRVPRDSAVRNPDLDGLAWAARQAGVRKMKRDPGPSHPQRPHRREGRLWISGGAARKALGASNKEEIMQIIGGVWREHHSELLEQERSEVKQATRVSGKRSHPQRAKSQAARQAARRSQMARQESFKKRRKR